MTTRLEGTLKREIVVDGAAYTLSIDTQGLKLVPKGKRKGYELGWTAFMNGEAALAAALNASMASAPPLTEAAAPAKAAKKKRAKNG